MADKATQTKVKSRHSTGYESDASNPREKTSDDDDDNLQLQPTKRSRSKAQPNKAKTIKGSTAETGVKSATATPKKRTTKKAKTDQTDEKETKQARTESLSLSLPDPERPTNVPVRSQSAPAMALTPEMIAWINTAMMNAKSCPVMAPTPSSGEEKKTKKKRRGPKPKQLSDWSTMDDAKKKEAVAKYKVLHAEIDQAIEAVKRDASGEDRKKELKRLSQRYTDKAKQVCHELLVAYPGKEQFDDDLKPHGADW